MILPGFLANEPCPPGADVPLVLVKWYAYAKWVLEMFPMKSKAPAVPGQWPKARWRSR